MSMYLQPVDENNLTDKSPLNHRSATTLSKGLGEWAYLHGVLHAAMEHPVSVRGIEGFS